MAGSRPYVILNAAMSIDGKIATRDGRSKLSSTKDLIRVHKLRSCVDAIIVGRRTILVDDPSLTVRHVKGKNPVRVIIDPLAKISPRSKIVITSQKIPTILAVSERAPKKRVSALTKKGLEVIAVGNHHVGLKKLLSVLEKRGMKRVLLEGGGVTNWNFFKEKLIDEIIVTVSPFVVGGKNATSLVDGQGFSRILESQYFTLKGVKRVKDEVVLRYVH